MNLAGVTPVRFLEDGRGVYSATVNASTRNDPRYNRVRLVESIGQSWYKGVTLALNKRYANGVHFALNYGWGKGIDTAPLGGATLAIQGDAARADPANLAIDKGPNQLDIRHTFNGSIVAISTVKRFNPTINKILSDNQISLILLVNSGQPDGIAGSRDLNLDGNASDRPLYITRNSMHTPVRENVDMRYSRFFQLRATSASSSRPSEEHLQHRRGLGDLEHDHRRRRRLSGGSSDTGAAAAVIDLAEHGGLPANGWREQRKFQLGFKFFF